MVQWLRHCTSLCCKGHRFDSGLGTRTLHGMRHSQKKKKKLLCIKGCYQERERTTQNESKVFVNNTSDKLCPYNEMWHGHKKEGSTDTCYYMVEPWKHVQLKKYTVWPHFCEMLRTGKFRESESRLLVAWVLGDNGEWLLYGVMKML